MNIYSIMLFVVITLLIILLRHILKNQKEDQLTQIFAIDIVLLIFQCVCTFVQTLFTNISVIYYIEYFTYIANAFLPVSLFFTGLIFANTKINFKRKYLLLFIIPIISLTVLWTNDYHHLFIVNYSIDNLKMVYGDFSNYIYSPYTYLIMFVGIFYMLKYSIKNAGFFSKQAILFAIGSLIPIITNILAAYQILDSTIYVTPISFVFTVFCYAFAIFKFKFLSVTPIAMQRIVDRISDSFMVLNEDNVITDFNDTLLKTFNLSANNVRNKNFITFINNQNIDNLDINSIIETLEKCKNSTETFLFKRDFKIKDKFFNIEVNGIFSKNTFLGNLILLKDVTQHIKDMKTIEDNQSMLMEKERLASLGQMIGGIAHNLKTPIMSISGAAEGLKDLTKEYDISIGDPTVTNEDHHAIVRDMDTWIEKIQTHTSYMSDVITAVKGQAVAFTEGTSDSFTIKELLTYTDVLMKHELKNALVELNTSLLVPDTISIKGNINSLVQVINNIISNAIQSYNGKPNKNIDFIIKTNGNNLVFTIQDYGSGIPKKVKDKLFKEMITTKGKNGTGLGLFMSYSNIRAHFNGNMTFESEEGKGTKFIITIPMN